MKLKNSTLQQITSVNVVEKEVFPAKHNLHWECKVEVLL